MKDEDYREYVCLGCQNKITGNCMELTWDKEYQKWHYIDLGYLCEKCYPIYKNLIPIIKKKIRSDFSEAVKDLRFRFQENMKEYY